VADHDYAKVDVKEEEDRGARLVKIRNPWVQNGNGVVAGVETGLFWLDFDTLCSRFDSIYFNWNPNLFVFRKSMHFIWSSEMINTAGVTHSHWKSPQYVVSNTSDNEVVATILVMKHLGAAAPDVRFFSVALYSGGSKLIVPEDAKLVARTTAMNTRYSTLRVTIPPRTMYTAVVCCSDTNHLNQNQPKNVDDYAFPAADTFLRFTMTVYASRTVKFSRARQMFPYVASVGGSWTREQAGGRWSLGSYLTNPQYKLCVDADAALVRVHLICNGQSPINVQLFWSGGGQLHTLTERDRISTSGDYREGNCTLSARELRRGEYTLIPSAFDARVAAQFTIIASSIAPIRLVKLPEINSGLFQRSATRQWNGRNRAEIPFHVARSSEVEICFQVDESYPSTPSSAAAPVSNAYRPHIRLCVFDGQNLVSTNNSFVDPTPSLILKHYATSLHQYVLVVERMEAGDGAFTVQFYADSPAIILSK
jgi:hypothetical protein